MKVYHDKLGVPLKHGQFDSRLYPNDSFGGVGSWTDNGGYYHYSIGIIEPLGETHEEMLPKVKADHDELDVRFKRCQFDSRIFPKDCFGGVGSWTDN